MLEIDQGLAIQSLVPAETQHEILVTMHGHFTSMVKVVVMITCRIINSNSVTDFSQGSSL